MLPVLTAVTVLNEDRDSSASLKVSGGRMTNGLPSNGDNVVANGMKPTSDLDCISANIQRKNDSI